MSGTHQDVELPPPGTLIVRKEDMSPRGRLRLVIADDGDIGLAIVEDSGHVADIEFCLPGTGGGKSPHTHKALRELAKAIILDNKESPERAADR